MRRRIDEVKINAYGGLPTDGSRALRSLTGAESAVILRLCDTVLSANGVLTGGDQGDSSPSNIFFMSKSFYELVHLIFFP